MDKTIIIAASKQPFNQYAGGTGGVSDSEHAWMQRLAETVVNKLATIEGVDPYLIPAVDVNNDGELTYRDNVIMVNNLLAQLELEGIEPMDVLFIAPHSNSSGDSMVLSGKSATSLMYRDRFVNELNANNIMPFNDVWTTYDRVVSEMASTNSPAILVEFGRHDNVDYANWLRTNITNNRLGNWFADRILAVLGVTPKVKGETMASSMTTVNAAGAKLRSDAADSYFRMLNAGMPTGGIQVFSRTMAQQAALRARYERGEGPIAARPSPNAPHIKGVAMDAITGGSGPYAPSSAHVWLSTGGRGGNRPDKGEYLQAHDFGWRRSVPSERWHWQYDPNLDLAKALKRGTTAKYATRIVQAKLGLHADGAYGPSTENAVKAFQRSNGLTPDGVVGSQTWARLFRMPKPVAPKPKPKPATPTTPTTPNGKIKLKTTGVFDTETVRRWKQLLGFQPMALNGTTDKVFWTKVGTWMGLGHAFSPSNRADVKRLQTVLGMPPAQRDGKWYSKLKRTYGPITTRALQNYLNNR